MKSITVILLTALLFCSCKKNPVAHTEKKVVDSTSHNYQWNWDLFGEYPSVITGIWGNRPNNVYAVGYIYSNKQGDPGTCLLHYNGSEWKRIELVADMNSVFGFSDSSIWLAGAYGSHADIYKYNGKTFTNFDVKLYPLLQKIWGTSEKNIYAVGASGTILHYDGKGWYPETKLTTLPLRDIWGTSSNDIYITGGDQDKNIGVLLHFNGTTWKKLYERADGGDQYPQGYADAIWGYDSTNYMLFPFYGVSDTVFQGSGNNWKRVYAPVGRVFQQAIHGTSSMNYFFIGDFGMINHWNGKSWHRFDEFYRHSDSNIFFCCWAFENEVFIGGHNSTSDKALIYHGKIYQ